MIQEYRNVVQFLERYNIEYCLAGGLAVIEYGHSRSTEDIDFFIAVSKLELANVLQLLASELPITHVTKTDYMLTVYVNGIRVDFLPYGTEEEIRALKHAVYKNIFSTRTKVVRLEDLILLKASIADTEPRHMYDVIGLCKHHTKKIDRKYMKEGIKALHLERFTPHLEELLGFKL